MEVIWNPDPEAEREEGGRKDVNGPHPEKTERSPHYCTSPPAKPIKYLCLPSRLVVVLIERLLVLCHHLLRMYTLTHMGTRVRKGLCISFLLQSSPAYSPAAPGSGYSPHLVSSSCISGLTTSFQTWGLLHGAALGQNFKGQGSESMGCSEADGHLALEENKIRPQRWEDVITSIGR